MEWKKNKLSSLGAIQTGSTPKTSIKENFGNFIPFIKPADFRKSGEVNYENEGLSKEGLAQSRLIKQNSVLMVCIGATIGKVGFTTIDITANQQINSFTPFDGLITKYCYYAMLNDSFKRKVIFNSGQATLPIINKTKWSNLELTYPIDIEEQKRIVTILDQVFADIEQARAKAEQNLKNARELFESYLQQVFSQRGEGWSNTDLGEVAEFKNGLNFSQSSKGEKLKIVGVKDFKSNFMVPYEQLNTIQIDGDLSKAYELQENDIITVRSNGNKRLIGRCLLMGKVDSKTSYSGFTIRIRLKNNSVNAEFLAYYMKSASTHELLINSGEGANISNLNQKILTALPVSYPSYEKQIQLLANIKKIEVESDSLKRVYAEKLTSIDELKKSILQKAFSGELTDNLEKEC